MRRRELVWSWQTLVPVKPNATAEIVSHDFARATKSQVLLEKHLTPILYWTQCDKCDKFRGRHWEKKRNLSRYMSLSQLGRPECKDGCRIGPAQGLPLTTDN